MSIIQSNKIKKEKLQPFISNYYAMLMSEVAGLIGVSIKVCDSTWFTKSQVCCTAFSVLGLLLFVPKYTTYFLSNANVVINAKTVIGWKTICHCNSNSLSEWGRKTSVSSNIVYTFFYVSHPRCFIHITKI